jgi:aldehyde dehydrogenase (NAD+)
VSEARRAFDKTWRKIKPSERAKYIFRVARLIQEKSRALAVAETLNGGKPIKESRDIDIPLAAAHFFYYAGWADKLAYAFPTRRVEPLGVAGQIIPWNFPLLMAAWKIAPALAAGNTVVLKPAETTPLTAMMLAEIFQEADLPPGVVNIITGAGATGAALVRHPDVDKIAFTGSTEVGKRIQRALAGTGQARDARARRQGREHRLRGCSSRSGGRGNRQRHLLQSGHVCCAGSRLFVQESIAEPLMRKLRARIETLRLGDPLDKNTDIGAINSRQQLEKIQELVEAGWPRGPRCSSLPASFPRAASGSRRRSSPASRSRAGSRRKRSSARYSRC